MVVVAVVVVVEGRRVGSLKVVVVTVMVVGRMGPLQTILVTNPVPVTLSTFLPVRLFVHTSSGVSLAMQLKIIS